MKWSSSYKSSKQPRRQRLYVEKAPLHIKRKLASSHLSKELRKRYAARAVPVRKGDKVRIMRGTFRKKAGKIAEVNVKESTVYIEGIQVSKKDGNKVWAPIHTSQLEITELDLSDKRREEALARKQGKGRQPQKEKAVKASPMKKEKHEKTVKGSKK